MRSASTNEILLLSLMHTGIQGSQEQAWGSELQPRYDFIAFAAPEQGDGPADQDPRAFDLMPNGKSQAAWRELRCVLWDTVPEVPWGCDLWLALTPPI